MSKSDKNKEYNEDTSMLVKIIKRTLATYDTIVAQS